MRRRAAFTLVELLVVIGVIALLISMLLPALQGARRAANTAKCLAQMRQFGSVFQIYSTDNKGYWPMVFHSFAPDGDSFGAPAGRTRAKRWPDFIGKYLNNNRPVNFDGTGVATAEQDTLATLKTRGNSLFWGCPNWSDNQRSYLLNATGYTINTTSSTLHFGYAMNQYVFAPAPVRYDPASRTSNWTYRAGSGTATSTGATGWYYKQSQYKRPAERCLIADNTHRDMSVNASNPWWTPFGWTRMPPVPDILSFTLDFNRHAKNPLRVGYTEKTLNVLFCDGHAATVSTREAHQSVRMHLGN